MGRDDGLLGRLYARRGGSDPVPPPPGPPGRPPRRVGIVPALWIVGLLLFFAGAALTALISALLAVRSPPMVASLREWGVVADDEVISLYHDHSESGDGTAGCLVTDAELVRWDDRVRTAAVDLVGADVSYELDRRPMVVVEAPDGTVVCPFGFGEDAQGFADALRGVAARRRQEPWGPGRRDPRL